MKKNKGLVELTKLRDKFKKLNDKDIDQFAESLSKRVALEFLGYVIPDTPSDTGALKRGWIGLKSGGSEPSYGQQQNFVNHLAIAKASNKLSWTIANNTEYGIYVEYGHFTPNRKGWVDGQFMMKNAINNVRSVLPALASQYANQYFKDYFKK